MKPFKLFALSYLLIGAVLLAVVIDPSLTLGNVTFREAWARVALGIVAAPVALMGLRGLFRRPLTPEQALALPEQDRRRVERRAKILSALGLLIVVLAFLGEAGWGLVLGDGAACLLGFAGLWVFFAGMLAIGGRRVALTVAREKRIAAGLRGRATILAVRDTGWTVNEDPKVELDLEVAIEGRAPYRVKHQCLVPRLMIGRLVPQGSFPVRVDPDDPNALLVDWNGA